MTTLGAPMMSDAEMQRWADTMNASKPKFAGGLQREDHRWKTAGIVAKKSRVVASPAARTPCLAGEAHRYRIPEPAGRHTLPGTCAKCGTEREFVVSGDTDWFSEESRQGKGQRAKQERDWIASGRMRDGGAE